MCNNKTLIVDSTNYVRSMPVFIETHDLTYEISRDEDMRFSKDVPIMISDIDNLIKIVFAATDPSLNNKDRAKLTLYRLLLGPVTVPCYCEDWEVNNYMTQCGYFCKGTMLYVYQSKCNCPNSMHTYKYNLMNHHHTTHVFRGLLSFAEWNSHIPSLFCSCVPNNQDKYAALILPNDKQIFLKYYPFFLCFLINYISIVEIEQSTNDLIVFLGPQVSTRIITHFKILFGFRSRPSVGFLDIEILEKFFILEIQKLWLYINKHNKITEDFFSKVFERFYFDKTKSIQILTLSEKQTPTLTRLCLSIFKKQILYLGVSISIKKSKKDSSINSFVFGKYLIIFNQLIWRNLFLIYNSCTTHPNYYYKECEGLEYFKIISRLSYKFYRQQHKNEFNFKSVKTHSKTESCFPGGIDFNEMITVKCRNRSLNAFNTNKVINVKATLSESSNYNLHKIPKNMTHSFVMYKHTFKEPAFTISTFVSNDNIDINSLNINIRGPYSDFLYTLSVYKLHVNIKDLFLPVFICNSNNSMDLQALENQDIIRARNKVYWIPNFPCMISTSNKINVGWFKAATAIVPKVSGLQLQEVMSKELFNICNTTDLYFDQDLHNLLIFIEKRNFHQIPFLIKQFLLFLRLCLLIRYPENSVHKFLLKLISNGFFDYNKNSIANTKIKHACALVGTRIANNIPKILSKHKKLKIDHLGRNANTLTVIKYIILNGVKKKNHRILFKILNYLINKYTSSKIRQDLILLQNILLFQNNVSV